MFLLLPWSALAVDATHASGMPIPRFAALKSGDVNVRTGPGTRYPIQWVYHRDGLPVEIIEEFDYWRKIRDVDNVTGWVHKNMLEGKRRVIMKSKMVVLRDDPQDDASAVAKAQHGVIARLISCKDAWCRVQVESRKAWAKRKDLWGVYENEEVK